MLPVFTSTKSQECSNVRNILKPFEKRNQVKKVIIGRIINPSFYGDCIVYSLLGTNEFEENWTKHTLMEHVTKRTVI